MDVKEAVAKAKSYIEDLFAEELPEDIGLEEVEFDKGDREWAITIGFKRPWNRPRNKVAELARPRHSLGRS